MKNISIKLPESLIAKLELLGKHTNETRSALLRKAIETFLDSENERQAYSCLDCAGDLEGIIQAPSDLSTNKHHLKDYGQ